MSSVMGAVVGMVLKLKQGLREGGVLPFGPFLVSAGLACLFANPLGFTLRVP